MRHKLSLITGLAASAMLLAACGSSTPTQGTGQNVNNTGGSGSKGSSADNWTQTAPASSLCSGKGTIVTIPATTVSGSYQTCTGRIAESHFMNALCTCQDAHVAGYLRSRAFNSKKGTSVDLGGSVGINQTYVTAGFTDVGGAFSIAGSQSLTFAGYLKTGGDLRTEGTTMVPGYTEVGRDLWIADGYTDVGPLTVHLDLLVARPHGRGELLDDRGDEQNKSRDEQHEQHQVDQDDAQRAGQPVPVEPIDAGRYRHADDDAAENGKRHQAKEKEQQEADHHQNNHQRTQNDAAR